MNFLDTPVYIQGVCELSSQLASLSASKLIKFKKSEIITTICRNTQVLFHVNIKVTFILLLDHEPNQHKMADFTEAQKPGAQ